MKQYYVEHFDDTIESLAIVTGGGAFSVALDETFTLIYGSERYYQIHEYTKETMEEQIQNHCIRYVHPDDRKRVGDYCQRCLEERQPRIDWEMRIISAKGDLKYVKCAGVIEKGSKIPLLHGFVIDITETVIAEKKQRKSREMLLAAMEHTELMYWLFDFEKDVCINGFRSIRDLHMPEYMADYPQCVIDSGLIHPDSAEEFKAIHQQLKAGATCVELDIKVTSEGGEIQWKRVKYTTLSEGGEPATQALGTSEDITAQKIAEEKFYKQMSYKNIMEQNVMASFHLNLTKNTCGDGQSAFPFLLNLQEDGTVDGLFRKVMKSLPQGEQREAYGKIFGRENMLRSFAAGERHLTYEHKYQVEDGRFEWIVTHGNLMENPVTKEVEALLYAFNVHEQKIMKDLFSKVVAIDYDYIIQLNGREDSYIMYYSEQINSRKPSPKSNNYSQTFSDYCKAYVISEDPEKTAQSMNIETIKAELEDKQTYNVVLKIREKDNSQAIKKLQYSYIDKENELIMLTRSDVTEMFQKEEKKAEALRTALVAARQANTAKTDFLSRMSHEIRTPMNAIIGMSTIAAQSIGNNDRIVDCISKIGISSHFLLSLINDILDMSRIESGKMLLRQEEFAFADFLSNVNSICHAQTAGKGIAYECIVDHTVDGFYVGDSVKLQQILINILSNAVKFTPEEGKITLRAEKINTEKAYTTLRFSVKDTGCGIEAEFLPYIFDAFSQEDSGKTTKFGGTGLGLAICKNLVSLMDGRIDVNSIVGVGTEFIVEVKLENSQREELALAKQPRETFPNLEILVVDDDLIVCESATATLEEMGINASWVDSGAKAIAEVKKRKEEGKPYDILLVDWKMPEMNGIETTREIRKIVGPEVTIIIMTAYEWVQIEHEAKLAGVNLMMSKPMFKASMVSALHNVLGKKEENDTAKKIDFDFTGKKVLLVEDHPLNVEVAKQLLSRKGFQVEHAENGVMAIEKFASASVGYYHAILMDIRMPIMDGLQATTIIRNLDKEDAKTIPIIAMTANAFAEDAESSKKAGMNAHLAKPIDPMLLYKTLDHAIKAQEWEE